MRPPRPPIHSTIPLTRPTNPAILPIPPRFTGNNVPKSLHKTRRSWWPNIARVNLAVDVLARPSASSSSSTTSSSASSSSLLSNTASLSTPAATPNSTRRYALKGVKMNIGRMKDIEKAGGVEGLLLSRPSKALTPFGRTLRAVLFERLHERRALQNSAETVAST